MMQIVHSPRELGPRQARAITIGNFDGVHLGHQALIRRLLRTSAASGLSPVLMTFWPHPRQVLFPERGHCPLTSRADRFALLELLGVPCVLEMPFTHDLAAMEAATFVREMLLPLGLRRLIIGYDFTLGHNRGGSGDVLRELGALLHFDVEQLDPVPVGGTVVSSTTLRRLIGEGDVAKAATLLGRWYGFSGEVLHGDGRGTGLGFPTANQRKPDVVLPAEGVYATRALVDDSVLPAVSCVGRKPTFGENEMGVETFLLEGGRELYGHTLRLEFVEKLRSERRFASAADLAAQIALDVREARRILKGASLGESLPSTKQGTLATDHA